MNYHPQPPRAPPPPPSRFPGHSTGGIGDNLSFQQYPPQQQQVQGIYGPEDGSSSRYDKKRPRSQNHDGGGRTSNRNFQGSGRGRGNSSSGSHYGNNTQLTPPNSNYNPQSQNKGKSLFKPDMILDPWRQLATKMVREGLLSAHESEDCFSPKTSSDKSDNFSVNNRASGVQNTEMNSVDSIEAI